MQSPVTSTFGFRDEFDLNKPHRLIDQRRNITVFLKKAVVLAEHDYDLGGKSRIPLQRLQELLLSGPRTLLTLHQVLPAC